MVETLAGLITSFTTEDHDYVTDITGSYYFGLHIFFFVAYKNQKLQDFTVGLIFVIKNTSFDFNEG